MFVILLIVYGLACRRFPNLYPSWLVKWCLRHYPIGLQLQMKLDFLMLYDREDASVKYKKTSFKHLIYAFALVMSIWCHLGFAYYQYTISLASLTILYPYYKILEQERQHRQNLNRELPGILSQFAMIFRTHVALDNALELTFTNRTSSFSKRFMKSIEMMKRGLPVEKALLPIGQYTYDEHVTRLIRIIISEKNNGAEDTYGLLITLVSDHRHYRKATLRKAGEEASTKLLMPMAIALIGIILALVYPALIELFTF